MGEIFERAKLIFRAKSHASRERSRFRPNRDQLWEAGKTLDDLHRVGALNDVQAGGLRDVLDDMTVKAPGIDVDGLAGIGSERIDFAKKVLISTDRPGILDPDHIAAIDYAVDVSQRAEGQASTVAQPPQESWGISRRTLLLGLTGTAVGLGLRYLIPDNSSVGDRVAEATVVPVVSPTVKPTPMTVRLSGRLGVEQQAWEKVLGTLVEIEPFPSAVTPEVENNLGAFGFKVMYLPKLELGSLSELRSRWTSLYLDDLQSHYPNWKHYERMINDEKINPRIPRNLTERFWVGVENGEFNFPTSGRWVAVENMPKPDRGEKYGGVQFSSMLGFTNRFGVSRVEVSTALDREKARFLAKIGLKDLDIRLPEPLEWNLMANREGWGENKTMELVSVTNDNTVYVGNSETGGAGSFWMGMASARQGSDSVGFRTVVVFRP